MKRGPAMTKLLSSASPGYCFCGKKLGPVRGLPRIMCSKARCRSRYQRAYREDTSPPTFLRRVVRIVKDKQRSSRRWAVLACGHRFALPRSLALRWRKRRRCRECQASVSAEVK